MPFEDSDLEFTELFGSKRFLSSNRQKLFIIISKNDNLLDVILHFENIAFLIGINRCQKLRTMTLFSDYYYEFYFENTTFVDLNFEYLLDEYPRKRG